MIGLLTVLACWATTFSGVLNAQEAQPAPEASGESKDVVETLKKKEDVPESGEKKPDAKPGEETPAEEPAGKKPVGLGKQLVEDLIGKAREQAVNPLDGIVEGMRVAQERLKKTETNKETRDLQSQIVKDLDDLINQLKSQKPPPPPKSDQNQPPPPPMGGNEQNQQPPRGSGQPKPQNSQKESGGGGQPKPQQATSGQTQSDKARESSDNPLQRTHTPEEEAARQRMAKDVWGHLPPALRQQLLNVYSEKFLPKYDDMVRKYYEALAEQNRKNP